MAQGKLRILCFGDSLTSGYTAGGAISHPYEERLVERLAAALPDVSVESNEDGMAGDVSGFFMSRIIRHCE